MVQDIIPPLGSIGTYTFRAPFDTTLSQTDMYTCQATRTISELLSDNVDVLAKYYIANGLSEVDYNLAVKNNTVIVTLQADVGVWVHLPANYIITPPVSNGIPYHVIALGISLGPIPVSTNLAPIKSSMVNLIRDNFGIISDVKELQVSKVKIVPYANDVAIRNARKSLITVKTTDTARLLTLQQNYNNALLKIQQLEAYILANKTKLGI